MTINYGKSDQDVINNHFRQPEGCYIIYHINPRIWQIKLNDLIDDECGLNFSLKKYRNYFFQVYTFFLYIYMYI